MSEEASYVISLAQNGETISPQTLSELTSGIIDALREKGWINPDGTFADDYEDAGLQGLLNSWNSIDEESKARLLEEARTAYPRFSTVDGGHTISWAAIDQEAQTDPWHYEEDRQVALATIGSSLVFDRLLGGDSVAQWRPEAN